MTKRCLPGSISGKPARATTKCKPFGVMVPSRRWCGVRALLVRGSLVGLVSVRTTLLWYSVGRDHGSRFLAPWIDRQGLGGGCDRTPDSGRCRAREQQTAPEKRPAV